MNKNEISLMIASVVIAVVVVSGVLIPIVGISSSEQKTFDNTKDALFEMIEIDENTNYTFEWKYTDPTNAIVNGETIPLEGGTILCSVGEFLIRYGVNSDGAYIQSVGSIGIHVNVSTVAYDLTITISGGNMTAVYGDSTVNATITDGFAIAKSGNWVMKSPTQSAYVLKDSRIVAMGLTFMDTWNRAFYIDGTVENVNVSCFNSTEITISNIVVNSNVETNYNDLYTVDSITFDASKDTDTWHATYNYFIVPAKVTVDNPNFIGGTIGTIVGIIPLFVVISLIIGIASYIKYRRY